VAAEQAIVSVFEQIVAVLARKADAAIDDTALFRLTDTLFAAFARAGEDGLTVEQMKAACAAFPHDVIENRLGVLRRLGAIQPAFDNALPARAPRFVHQLRVNAVRPADAGPRGGSQSCTNS
jgi:hypothetical protein